MTGESSERARLRHELRTPLNHIIGYGEMLLEDAEAASRRELVGPLRQMLEDARYLLARINEVLASSEVDAALPDLSAARGATWSMTRVDPGASAQDVAAIIRRGPDALR